MRSSRLRSPPFKSHIILLNFNLMFLHCAVKRIITLAAFIA